MSRQVERSIVNDGVGNHLRKSGVFARNELAALSFMPSPPTPLILVTEADYQAAAARFWDLIGTNVDLAELMALREALRTYEQVHEKANNTKLRRGPG